jgi:hypothetical protein
MINIFNRNSITDILPLNSVGCELGVFEGEFSQILWNSGKFTKLYLVDLFEGHASNFGKAYNDCSVLESVVKNKFHMNNAVSVIKQDSISFLNSIANNYFNFIYIDTMHDYEHTAAELEKSYRCVKNNGFICGHDYSNAHFPGVVKAVNEFCKKLNCSPIQTSMIEDYPSFIIPIAK